MSSKMKDLHRTKSPLLTYFSVAVLHGSLHHDGTGSSRLLPSTSFLWNSLESYGDTVNYFDEKQCSLWRFYT
jgi:hypothetical protein